MQAADLGHGRTMHTRAMDADEDGNVVTEVVIVATDIEAPKAKAFATEYPFDANPTDAIPAVNRALNIVDGNLAMIATDGITATGAGTITLDAAVEDMESTPEDETVVAFETAAMFDGASGMLKCGEATDCTATLDDEGMITDVTGGWIFTPADGATVDVDDADYLHYGFWLMRTTDADGVLTYNEVETFAGSSVDASVSVGDVDGSATYEGGATGVYVKSVSNPDGTEASATSGHFMADASLMATFGQVPVSGTDDPTGTIAPNVVNTLSGTIDNFQLAGGEYNEWEVTLQGKITTNDGTAAGTAKGGGADDGSFSATFHGLTPLTEADDDDAQASVAPGAVVGEFNANFSNGTVAGGFGARKQ